MRFTDYYAEASCTAGRANFITGELPIRTGLTTVGQAGAPLGIPDEAVTIAQALKSMGYATGQFGKNHLGDRNNFCRPCMASTNSSDTCTTWMRWKTRRTATIRRRLRIGRTAQHAPLLGHRTDDPTVMPRWGKIGKQKIEDAGELYPKRMETVDDEILDFTIKFMDKAQHRRKAVLRLAQPDAHARRDASVRKIRIHA